MSPFLFEDFCAALTSEEQSLLLAEIHIAFLKLALKNDEEEQVTLSVQDTNSSFNIIAHLVEPMTYAEVILVCFRLVTCLLLSCFSVLY